MRSGYHLLSVQLHPNKCDAESFKMTFLSSSTQNLTVNANEHLNKPEVVGKTNAGLMNLKLSSLAAVFEDKRMQTSIKRRPLHP